MLLQDELDLLELHGGDRLRSGGDRAGIGEIGEMGRRSGGDREEIGRGSGRWGGAKKGKRCREGKSRCMSERGSSRQCEVQCDAQCEGACARGLRIPGGDSSGDSSPAGEIAPLAVRWLSTPVRETRSSAGLTWQGKGYG